MRSYASQLVMQQWCGTILKNMLPVLLRIMPGDELKKRKEDDERTGGPCLEFGQSIYLEIFMFSNIYTLGP